MRILREYQCRGFLSPPLDAGETIGSISDHSQVVGNRFGLNSEFGDDARFIAYQLTPAIELHDSRSDHTLAQVFVGSADENLSYAVIRRGSGSGGSERVIRFKIDHRPHDYAHGFESFFQDGKLRKQFRSDAFAGFIFGVKVVAERLHDVIGRNSQMGSTA